MWARGIREVVLCEVGSAGSAARRGRVSSMPTLGLSCRVTEAGNVRRVLTNRLWMRLRSLFVPSVSIVALLDLVGKAGAADAVKQLYDWERDRLFTLSKGLAAAGVGVLTTLVIDAIENKVSAPVFWIYLSAVLVGMLMVWAAFILTGLRRLSEQYALALRLFA
jgi:hypothetical protein